MVEVHIERSNLDISKIIASGQVFNYEILSETRALFKHLDYFVIVETKDFGYCFYCEEKVFNDIWYYYFDLDRNYDAINKLLVENDNRLEPMITLFEGVRILHQDPFEVMITFILSQSKAIPQIRKLIQVISKQYGTYMGNVYSDSLAGPIDLYRFPCAKQLEKVTEADFRELKCGYRAPYLVDAIQYALNNSLEALHNKGNDYIWNELLSIKGIGNKVASCVMLFGFASMEMFPVDTWMRKIMKELYFANQDKISDIEIERFGRARFGEYAGIAQQYLFEFGRNKKKF